MCICGGPCIAHAAEQQAAARRVRDVLVGVLAVPRAAGRARSPGGNLPARRGGDPVHLPAGLVVIPRSPHADGGGDDRIVE